MSANIENLTNDSFQTTVDSTSTPVLVDFWAPWCGPCKQIAPVLEELATELDGQVKICKLDVDQNSDVAAKFGVRAIPTLLLFKGGQVVEQIVGLVGKADLRKKIDQHTAA